MIKNLRFVFLGMLMLVCGSALAEDVIWSEDWSGYTKNQVPSEKNSAYSEEGSGTKIYAEKLAGGTAPELLIGKNNGSFTAVINLNGKTGEMTLSYMANYDRITVTAQGAALGTKVQSGNSYTIPVTVNTGVSSITLTFTNTNSSNVRFDDVKLYQGVAKQNAGLSWGTASREVTLGSDKNLFPTLSNENELPVAYSSSDETVATISSEGVITLIAAGETVISAAFEGNDEFEAQTVSYTLRVKEDQQDEIPALTTVDKVLAGQDGTVYHVKGTCTKIANANYGNWYLNDETGEVYIYGTNDFSSQGIAVGDIVEVYGERKTYNETIELVDVTVLSITKGQETVADPVFTPEGGEFEESVTVAITAEDGAAIYYRFDETADWMEYTEALVLSETTTVYAKAVKGDVESNVVSATFTKKEIEQPVGDEVTFDFNASDHAVSDQGSHDGDLTEPLVLTEGGVTMTVTPADGGTANRFWDSKKGPQLRMYSGSMTLVAPAEKAIVKIVVDNGKWDTGNTFNDVAAETGEWTGNSTDVVLAVAGNTQMNKVVVTLADKDENTTTAISEVRQSDSTKAIYTLGGQRVAQPVRGLYIMGGKKVLVK